MNEGMEPESPSTYLLMYLQNMETKKNKEKDIQKYPNTKVQSVSIAKRKIFYSKNAEKQSQTAQLRKINDSGSRGPRGRFPRRSGSKGQA